MSDELDRFLIRSAEVLDLGDEQGGASAQEVRVAEGRIVAVEATLEPERGEVVIDATNMLLTPGLVNAHLHSSEALVRGRYENLPLELWALYAYPLQAAPTISSELIYLRTMLVALESLKTGVTTVVDDGPETAMLDIDTLGSVFSAYEDAGIRANCSGAVIDRSMLETMPGAGELPEEIRTAFAAGAMPTPEQYVEFSERAIQRFHGSAEGRLRYLIAPIAPQWCTDEMLQAAAMLSERHRINLHTHVLETATQLETSSAYYGKSLIRYLADVGALGSLTTIAHSVWVSEEDIQLIARNGASVVHNPISNQKLGAGVAPLRALLDAGINVGLGTDGMASSDTARLFDVLRSAALIHDVTAADYRTWPTAREVLRAATEGGARSVSLGDEVGRIVPGARADMVLFDLNTLPFTPRNDLCNHLIYSENGSSIAKVFVDGRLVVEDGRVLTVDEAEIIAAVNGHAEAFLHAQAAAEGQQRVFHDHVAGIVDRAIERRAGRSRLLP